MITRITLLASLLALPFLGKAEGEPKTVSTNIKAVTVFLNGAQVTRSARASLDAGTQQIKFAGLTAQLDPGSVQVQGEGDFTILSVTSEMNYPEPTLKDLPITEIVRLQTERLKISDKLSLEEALLQGIPNLVEDGDALRGLRWEYFATFNTLAPCINVHKMVFGPDERYHAWRLRVRESLVRVRGEVDLFELADGAAPGATARTEGFLPRLLSLTLGSGRSPGSCAALIAKLESGGGL